MARLRTRHRPALCSLHHRAFGPAPGGFTSVACAASRAPCASPLLGFAVGAAIVRYRLWDIDLIIQRTLVYVILSACVIGLYVLIVGYIGALFRTSNNSLISLIATALVAIVFQPLRSLLQRATNRLLYGERDAPYRMLARLDQQLALALPAEEVLPTLVKTIATALKLPYVAIALLRCHC